MSQDSQPRDEKKLMIMSRNDRNTTRPAAAGNHSSYGALELIATRSLSAEKMPELVRVDLNAGLLPAPLDHLVNPAGRHRAAAHPEPQRRDARQPMPGTLAGVPVKRTGGVVGEPHGPLPVALARDG